MRRSDYVLIFYNILFYFFKAVCLTRSHKMLKSKSISTKVFSLSFFTLILILFCLYFLFINRKCPQTLVAPIIRLALEKTNQTLQKSPEQYGFINANGKFLFINIKSTILSMFGLCRVITIGKFKHFLTEKKSISTIVDALFLFQSVIMDKFKKFCALFHFIFVIIKNYKLQFRLLNSSCALDSSEHVMKKN